TPAAELVQEGLTLDPPQFTSRRGGGWLPEESQPLRHSQLPTATYILIALLLAPPLRQQPTQQPGELTLGLGQCCPRWFLQFLASVFGCRLIYVSVHNWDLLGSCRCLNWYSLCGTLAMGHLIHELFLPPPVAGDSCLPPLLIDLPCGVAARSGAVGS